MFLGFGLSALIGSPYVGAKIGSLPRFLLPGLGSLPLRYTSQFQFDILIYLVVPIAIAVWFLLFRTRWGLGLRAIGRKRGYSLRRGAESQPAPLHRPCFWPECWQAWAQRTFRLSIPAPGRNI